MLEQAVDFEISARWQDDLEAVLVSVVVEGGHVGHRIPGGEFFRFLTLQITMTDDVGPIIPRRGTDAITKGREQLQLKNGTDVKLVHALPLIERMQRSIAAQVDTRLWPGEQRHFEYLIPVDRQLIDGELLISAEIWYHVMEEAKAREVGRSLDNVKRRVRGKESLLRLSELR